MKFIHLGDLHLGKSLGDFDLIEDQKFILEKILEIAEKESVDGVLIAGDVYDKSIPSESATHLLDNFLKSLADKKIKTFIISGNHDSDERLNYGSALFRTNDIFISSIYEGSLDKYTFQDEYGEIDIFLLPFVKASRVRHFFPEEKIENYDDAVRVIFEHAEIDEKRRNLIVAHQFVAGKGDNADPFLAGSEGLAAKSVGLVEKIGYDCFDKFDYAALGHIHSPQRVGRDEVRYSGSPLKYSLSEINNEKTVPIVTFGEKKDVKIELVPLKPRRDLRHIKGKLSDILDKGCISDTDDFIYVTLTDEEIINDAMPIIQQVYPNTVKIDYRNSHTKELELLDISNIAEKKSFDELIGDFYALMYGCEITEEEMDYMRDAAREAGVIHEAD